MKNLHSLTHSSKIICLFLILTLLKVFKLSSRYLIIWLASSLTLSSSFYYKHHHQHHEEQKQYVTNLAAIPDSQSGFGPPGYTLIRYTISFIFPTHKDSPGYTLIRYTIALIFISHQDTLKDKHWSDTPFLLYFHRIRIH